MLHSTALGFGVEHGLAVSRPARLLIELDPPILHILPARKPVVGTLRQPSSRPEMAGECAPQAAEGVGEEDVGDWEVGAQDAAEGFEHRHDSEGDADP